MRYDAETMRSVTERLHRAGWITHDGIADHEGYSIDLTGTGYKRFFKVVRLFFQVERTSGFWRQLRLSCAIRAEISSVIRDLGRPKLTRAEKGHLVEIITHHAWRFVK